MHDRGCMDTPEQIVKIGRPEGLVKFKRHARQHQGNHAGGHQDVLQALIQGKSEKIALSVFFFDDGCGFHCLLPPFQAGMRKQTPDQIQAHNPHNGQERPAGKNQKKYGEIILDRALFQIEVRMHFVVGHPGSRFGVAVQIGANQILVVFMGNGVGVFVTQHLMHGSALVYMTIEAIGNPFAQKICRLAVKGLAVRIPCAGTQFMTLHKFGVVMAAGANLGNVAGVTDFVQSGGNVVVKAINKLILFVADPAASRGGLGDAGSHGFEKRKRSVQRVIMAV